ncbi:hypothetical protein G6F40_014101 [Rhizopus arrhizus]|nr:hypothetical protein G6F40_014101 [Rhizopus arrhizus]
MDHAEGDPRAGLALAAGGRRTHLRCRCSRPSGQLRSRPDAGDRHHRSARSTGAVVLQRGHERLQLPPRTGAAEGRAGHAAEVRTRPVAAVDLRRLDHAGQLPARPGRSESAAAGRGRPADQHLDRQSLAHRRPPGCTGQPCLRGCGASPGHPVRPRPGTQSLCRPAGSDPGRPGAQPG